jgi:hypothetical protein
VHLIEVKRCGIDGLALGAARHQFRTTTEISGLRLAQAGRTACGLRRIGCKASQAKEREKGDANNEFLFGGSFAMVEGVWRAGAGCSAVGGLRVQAGEGG